MATLERPELSVVIPALNEEGNITKLYDRLVETLDPFGRTYEILFVDDGSRDGTAALAEDLCRKDPRVKLIVLRQNFGKAAALSEGFTAARGALVVTMDCDLQDDPAEIPKLVAKLDEGYDLVSGWKYPRRDPLSKIIPSKVINWVARWVTGVHLHDFNCGLKAYRLNVVQDLALYGELHRYIPVLVSGRGYRVGEVKVCHHPRHSGRSKYGVERFLRGFLDLITVTFLTRYNKRPIHLLGGIGALFFFLGCIANGYLSVLWLLGYGIGYRPLLFLGILLIIVGVQLGCFGLVAEMLTQLSHGRERDSLVRRTVGLDGRQGEPRARTSPDLGSRS
ncbi:MAG: glycosyltransferase family 2 protein [Candidatus Rokubacteria bacterium]|nr:glycosyltransferase family 2 protein [Candidatus Rokubacteria bacterium]